MKTIVQFCIFTLLSAAAATAANYYINPATGAIGNDGSAGSPWNTLAAVAAAKTFTGGDTVFLYGGYHGQASFNNTNYASPVVFRAVDGEVPLLKSISVGTGTNMVFDGLTVTPEAATPYSAPVNLITLSGGATYVTVQNCSLYSKISIAGWDSDDWQDFTAKYGFRIDGRHNTVRNCYVAHVRYGIMVNNNAAHTLAEYNTVEEFCVDGFNALGDSSTYQYNLVKNSYDIGTFRDGVDYHEDAFQSWAVPQGGGASIKKVTLRGNHFLNYETRDQPYLANMQGMGCFDGFYEGWRVENNLVVADMWHGIALYGAINCTLVNNTVMSPADAELTQLWIGVFRHKNGTEGRGCVVRNNLASFLDVSETPSTVADHNIAGTWARIFIMDHAGGDYTLKPGAPAIGGIPAIDGGSPDGAPLIDKDGTPRPQGAGVDIGCFEYLQPSPVFNAGYRPKAGGLTDVKLGPLPATAATELSYAADRPATVALDVYTPSGDAVRRAVFASCAGTNRHALNLDGLAAGIYLYRITTGGREYSRGRFAVQ